MSRTNSCGGKASEDVIVWSGWENIRALSTCASRGAVVEGTGPIMCRRNGAGSEVQGVIILC